jgi:glycosyltransferase involved in cell wall biosynthesis
MKKKLLFIIPSLSAGGGEKSLVNLLSQIDFNRYKVDLFLFNHEGIFMEFVPKEVNIIPLPRLFQIFLNPLLTSVIKLLFKGEFSLLFSRILFAITNRRSENTSIREQRNWKHISKALEKLEGKYDTAIGFLEKSATYFCVDKVEAANKIGWIHIDYDQLGMDPLFDVHYFNNLNKLVTVSEECATILQNRFPCQSHKIEVVYNIVSPDIINNMANQVNNVFHKDTEDEITILSIGRLHYQKGFELAIESCKLLVRKGYKVRWYVIGEGTERKKLTNLIKKNGLEKNFLLLGLKPNPYPFIKQADIYAQTSKFEGKSIAVDEAKILCKPIIVTNYSTAMDQINDGRNGLIVEMDPHKIAKGIERLINDKTLRKQIIKNLSKEKIGTEEEINKLYEVI